MFSSMKKEEYMESELSGIFQVKVVTNGKVLLQYDVLFWRNIQIFLTKLLRLSVSLVKQHTSFIYVERMSFYLVKWAFPIVGSRGPILCRKATNIFHAYED